MIGKLKGLIDSVETDHLIIDVGGVGYVAFCPSRTLAQLGEKGTAVELIIETHVREDHIHLYGFTSTMERDWFRILTSVQGVGVRMGLAILGMFSPDQLSTAIAAQDKKQLTAVSGVGPKLAERIVTELKSKVGSLPTSGSIIPMASGKGTKAAPASNAGAMEEATSALINLGFGRSDAYGAIARISQQQPNAKLDDLIRLGLQELAS